MTIKHFTVPERPADETERQAALDAYCVAEPLDDPELDAVVAEAAATFGVPTALVSLIDRERQWFPARVGMPLPSTPRSVSFCGHAIHQAEPLVVPDATADERFAGNPLVVDEGGIRFYAGAPLVTPEGHRIGTLCLIDSRPRAPLSDAESSRLQALAAKAMAVLERRRPS
jgi:GAF domain-containing protein